MQCRVESIYKWVAERKATETPNANSDRRPTKPGIRLPLTVERIAGIDRDRPEAHSTREAVVEWRTPNHSLPVDGLHYNHLKQRINQLF